MCVNITIGLSLKYCRYCSISVTEDDFENLVHGTGHKKLQNPDHCIQSMCTNKSAYTTNTAGLPGFPQLGIFLQSPQIGRNI